MAREPRQDPPAPGGTLELLLLALARPGEALARARAALAKNPGPYDASVARQAIGIVLREFGDVSAGIRELRTALRLAGSPDRQADVLATLGVALIYAGRTKQGLSALDEAVVHAAGPATGRVLERRAAGLMIMLHRRPRGGGALSEALRDARGDLDDDPVQVATGMSFLALGAG
jgi:tetratricopeptide (TPR) repeat protein